jgi:hypothetical protein
MATIDINALKYVAYTPPGPPAITAADVYDPGCGGFSGKQPAGYEFTGEFRLPEAGEFFLTRSFGVSVCQVRLTDTPVLILKRVEIPTVKSIYGTDSPPIPAGFRAGDMELVDVESYDKYYRPVGAAHNAWTGRIFKGFWTQVDYLNYRLRLHLVKKETRTRVIFEPTGELRPPKTGEWYERLSYSSLTNNFANATSDHSDYNERRIFTRREEQYEVEV